MKPVLILLLFLADADCAGIFPEPGGRLPAPCPPIWVTPPVTGFLNLRLG